MTTPTNVQDDLAFMKSLVSDGGRFQMTGGWVFMAAGLLYGAQCLLYAAQFQGAPLSPELMGVVTIFVNVAFFVALGVALFRDAKHGPRGMVSRAINAMFSGIGLANLAMVVVFGVNAAREESLLIWLLYPIVVCALQGAAWFTAWVLRKHAWLMAVALGWLATAIVLGFVVADVPTYVLVLGLALILLMALPGYVLMRLAKKQG